MRKILKILLITLVLGALMVPLLSCNPGSNEAGTGDNQVATVQRGDLTIDITAAGNLALSRTEDLAFDLFYQTGTVAEVLVEAGDTVEEGQVLARLDEEEWADQLSTLEDQVTARDRDLLQAEINLKTAEYNLKTSRDNEAAKELAILNAQISLDQAQRNLSTGIAAVDYQTAEAALRKAKSWYEYVMNSSLHEGTEAADDWQLSQDRAKEQLDAAQRNYDNILAGFDSNDIALKKLQVKSAEITLAQARAALDNVATDIATKEQLLTLSQGKLEDAKKALTDAQEERDKAKGKSPLITAPFAGFITNVNVEGGDEVLTGTVAVQLADPGKFEANIVINELDILQVKLGGEARIEVDAMPGMSLPATVAHISPTATIQSGVVNYEVKVEVGSLEAIRQAQQKAQQPISDNISSGELPERLKQAVAAGRLTQEQAEAMIKQIPAGQQPLAQMPAMALEDFQLREGLTVTVSILVDERTGVLLVPNSAITRRGGQTSVKVVSTDGTIGERVIQTGISDFQFTEVTGGIAEGEQVVVPQGTTATPAPSSQQQPQGGFPGMGRMLR